MRHDPDRERKREIQATPRGDEPLVPWILSENDRRFLRSIRVGVGDAVPPTRAEDGCE